MIKKAALISHQVNLRGVQDWYTLSIFQTAKDLALYLGKEVDVVSWGDKNFKFDQFVQSYDTVIITEIEQNGYRNTKQKKFIFDLLKKFVGKKLCLYPSEQLKKCLDCELTQVLKDYYKNDITEKFEEFLELKPNIVQGDEYALCLWTPDTRVIQLKDSFVFEDYKKFDTFTVFFGTYTILNRGVLKQVFENLFKRMIAVNSKKKRILIPVDAEMYYFDILELVHKYSTIFDIEVLKYNFNRKQRHFKQPIFDLDKGEIDGKVIPFNQDI